ncbi:MAG: hypothetical protein Q9204_007382 [Flavoplaca sp. TL-2023a]
MQSFKYIKVPLLSSLYIQDGRLPNLGADYTRLPQLRRHKWTLEEKQVLYVLSSHFTNLSRELWAVFNAHFKERRPRWLGPRKIAWETMKVFMMKPGQSRVSCTETAARRIRCELLSTASLIGIRLLPKYGGCPATPVRRRRGRQALYSLDSSSSGEDDGDHGLSASEESNSVRRKLFDVQDTPQGKGITVTNGLLTPPSTAKKHSTNQQTKIQTPSPVPSIAFRAFNQQSQGHNSPHGFKAGLFTNTVCIPPIPSEEIYLSELKRHLEKYHSGPTPFISVSPYLMRVIMHACRKDRELRESEEWEKGKGEWSVAVIALSKVKGDVREVRGLQAGWNAVRAWGEWVVYGEIPAENVLCVIPLSHLVAVMSSTTAPFYINKLTVAKNLRRAREAMAPAIGGRSLTCKDGVAVGRVLSVLGIPMRYADEVTSEILRDWRFLEGSWQVKGRGGGGFEEKGEKEMWMGNKGFLRGRGKGFGDVVGEWRELEDAVDNGSERDQEDETRCGEGTYDADFDPCQIVAGLDYGATEHSSALDTTTFDGFLQEMEEAAFDPATFGGSMRCGAVEGCMEDDGAYTIKEESPDCLALDYMPECFGA